MKKEELKAKAKMMALKDLKAHMKKKMGKGMDMKDMPMKVSVMSDSEEGIEEGLTQAQEIMKMKMGDEKKSKK